MARGSLADPTPIPLTIELHPSVHEALEYLATLGIFGATIEDVADRMICEKVRERAEQRFCNVRPLRRG